MSNLIPIFNRIINQEEIKLVNARELHQFLEVTSRFNDWINNRIKEYKFIENQDFILITKNLVTKTRGGDRRSKDYHITLDMAKELSMIERTEKGRQARKYFIECEKQLHAITKKTTVDQRTPLRDAVNLLVSKKGLAYSEAYSIVHQRFNVDSIESLALEQLPQAVEYVHKVALEGEYIANNHHRSSLSDDDWYELCWLFKASYVMLNKLADIAPALTAIRSDYACSVSTMAHEYKRTLEDAKPILIRGTAHIEPYSFKWQTVLPELRNRF